MGKNRTIKSLSKIIANVTLHKLLLKLTNKPESKGHLQNEIIEYGENAIEHALEYNWNDNDKVLIKDLAITRFKQLIKNYPDVKFDFNTAENLIIEMIDEII